MAFHKFKTIFWGFVFFVGCSDTATISSVDVLDIPSDIRYRALSVETVTLDSVYCSYNGLSGVTPDKKLYYLDRYFGYLYEFDTDGNMERRMLGTGRSNGETIIRQCAGQAFSKDGEFVIIGSGLNFDVYDAGMSLKKRFNLPYNPGSATSYRFDTYSYAWDNFVCRLYKGKIYMSMISEHPAFNYFDTSNKFLSQSYSYWYCRCGQ